MSESSEPGGAASPVQLWFDYADGVLAVHGEIDLATCDRFRATVQAVVGRVHRPGARASPREVHLDLAGVGFIGVAGARVLVAAVEDRPHDLELVLHHAPPMLSCILQLAWGHVGGLRLEQGQASRRQAMYPDDGPAVSAQMAAQMGPDLRADSSIALQGGP